MTRRLAKGVRCILMVRANTAIADRIGAGGKEGAVEDDFRVLGLSGKIGEVKDSLTIIITISGSKRLGLKKWMLRNGRARSLERFSLCI